jgi:hypothetical protein
MEQAIKNNVGKKSLLFNTIWLLLAVFLAPKFLGVLAALVLNYIIWPGNADIVWEFCVYGSMAVSAILMYIFVFWLAKQYIKKGFFADKEFKKLFLILVAVFFFLNFDFSLSIALFVVLVFYLKEPQLLSLKNPAYQLHLKMIYQTYLVGLGLALIGNIFHLVFKLLGQSNGHDYLAWMLFPRLTVPFFVLLIFVFYLIIKNGFGKTLQLSKAKYIFYLFAILISSCLMFIFLLLEFIGNFTFSILSESFMWLAVVLTFVAAFALFYNLARWLLTAKAGEAWWKYLLKLLANLIFIPICCGLLIDYISIIVYTVTNAFPWKDNFRIPNLLHPIELLYSSFVLIYFLKFKTDLLKNKLLAAITYFIIIIFVLSYLGTLIRIDLIPLI